MMCNVALERRMGFLSLDAGDLTQDMFTIMTALKGLYLLSSPALKRLYGFVNTIKVTIM